MITGGVKIFEQNYVGLSLGTTIIDTIGTGSLIANNAIDKNRQTYWQTSGSNDSTTETLTLTFPSATFNRLHLVDMNWKQFTAKWWNGSAFIDFTSVSGLDGSLSAISETAFADATAYYEFASVTTTQLQLTVAKTRTANAEKYIATILATLELGTLQGFPGVALAKTSRNLRQMTMLSGKQKIVKGIEVYNVQLDFSEYSANQTYSPDIDLLYQLHDRDTPFYIWPSGGRRGQSYFKYAPRTMRLQDIFLVQLVTDLEAVFPQGIYTSTVGMNSTLEFPEHV